MIRAEDFFIGSVKFILSMTDIDLSSSDEGSSTYIRLTIIREVVHMPINVQKIMKSLPGWTSG